jgi:tetratricopeptide (TPR) repeat protein
MRFIILFSLLACFLLNISSAQQSSPCGSTNKKATGFFKDAQALYQARKDYDKTKELLQKAIDEDPEFSDAYLLSGYLAMKKRDYKTMQAMLEKAIELCESTDAAAYYQLGWLQYDMKKYKEAEKYLSKFLETTPPPPQAAADPKANAANN